MLSSKYLRLVSFLRLWPEEENFCLCSVYGFVFTFKSEIKPMVSYVLLRKLFSRSSYFFSWRNYFRENFRLENFVRVSCIVRVSDENVKRAEMLIDMVCVWFLYGSCIGLKIPKSTDGILCSPEKIIFTMFTFSLLEIILEKILGFLISFVFRVWFVYRSKIWRPWGPLKTFLDKVFSRVLVWLCVCSWCPWRLL